MPLLLPVLLLVPFHDTTTSVATLTLGETASTYVLTADADRVMQSIGRDQPDGTLWSDQDLADAETTIRDYFTSRLQLSRDGVAVPLEAREILALRGFEPLLGQERVKEIRVTLRWPVPAGDFLLGVRQRLFEEAETGHAHVLSVGMGEQVSGPHVLYPRQTLELPVEDPSPAGRRRRMERFAATGWRAAVTDPELMGFVVLVLLGLPGVGAELLVLLALVVGCGVPLWLVGLDHLAPAPRAVGLAVHLAVGWVLFELFVLRDARLRWATAGLLGVVFGLDRGLAFAAPTLARVPCLATWHAGTLGALLLAGAAGVGVASLRRRLRVSRGRSA